MKRWSWPTRVPILRHFPVAVVANTCFAYSHFVMGSASIVYICVFLPLHCLHHLGCEFGVGAVGCDADEMPCRLLWPVSDSPLCHGTPGWGQHYRFRIWTHGTNFWEYSTVLAGHHRVTHGLLLGGILCKDRLMFTFKKFYSCQTASCSNLQLWLVINANNCWQVSTVAIYKFAAKFLWLDIDGQLAREHWYLWIGYLAAWGILKICLQFKK